MSKKEKEEKKAKKERLARKKKKALKKWQRRISKGTNVGIKGAVVY